MVIMNVGLVLRLMHTFTCGSLGTIEQTMFFSLVLLAGGVSGAILLSLLLLLRAFSLPPTPSGLVKSFVERARVGPIAHRGGKPENTLAAIRSAKAHGASGVEVDVRFTKDGHPVLIHDSTVDRTSDGSGYVHEMTLEEIGRLDFGIKCGSQYKGERIPTLNEAVRLCEELELLVFLDLKGDTGDLEKFVTTIPKLMAKRPHLYHQVAIVSFWPQILYKLRRADPNIVCSLSQRSGALVTNTDGSVKTQVWWKHRLLHRPFDLLFWSIDTWLWQLLGVSVMTPYKGDILEGRVNMTMWRKRDIEVITWTVNSDEEKTHFKDILRIPFITDHVLPHTQETSQN